MNKTNWVFIPLLICISYFSGYTQNIENTKSTGTHTVGISARRFLNVVFKESQYSPELMYLHRKKNGSYRVGINILKSSADNSYNLFFLSLGYQKPLRTIEKWDFYYGTDIMYQYEPITGNNTAFHSAGLLPFFGISFALSKQFTISTEPGIFGVFLRKIEPDSFVPSKDIIDIGMLNVGYIRLNFSF